MKQYRLLILRNFKINTTRGWVWEGLGLYLDYCLTGSHRTGDHTIYVGQVEAAGGGEGKPLLYYSGGYRAIESSGE